MDIKEVKKIIYQFYPTNLYYNTPEYQTSEKTVKRIKLINQKNECIKERLYLNQGLRKEFPHNIVIDWTTKEANCYEFKILLHENQQILDDDIELIENLNWRRYDLRIFVSVLAPVYYFFIEETTFDPNSKKWGFKKIEPIDNIQEENVKVLRAFFQRNEVEELDDKMVKQHISGIETELKTFNETIVFDCIFTDLVNIVLAD